MLPQSIQGLYTNVREQNGCQIGGGINYVIQQNGNADWIQQCASIVVKDKFKVCFAGGKVQSTPKKFAGITSVIGIPALMRANKAYMYTLGGVDFRGYQEQNGWYGTYYINNSIEMPGYALINDNTAPILNSIGKDHYIMVPTIRARNLEGTYWTGSLKAYREVAQTYPYINSVSVSTKWKPTFSGGSADCQIGIYSIPILCTDVERPVNGNIFRGYKSISFSNTILPALSLSTRIITPQSGAPFWTADYNDTGAIFPNVTKSYLGSIDTLTPANSIAPFLYYEFNDVIEALNSRGLWWVEDTNDLPNAQGEGTTSPYVHAPIILPDGQTTGLDYSGTDIGEHWNDPDIRPLGNITLASVEGVDPYSPYDPSMNYEQLEDTSEEWDLDDMKGDLELGASSYTGVGCFATYYAMSPLQVVSLNDELWTNDEEWYAQLLQGLKLWGADPMQSIMSFRLYPFDVAQALGVSASENDLYFGKVLMDTKAVKLPDDCTVILDLGTTWINRKNLNLFGDFRDLSPYTEVTLYIPFIGLVQINVNDFMNTLLRIKMTVDITTGSCCAVVYSNEKPYYYLPGTIGVEIPITLSTMTDIAVGLMSSVIDMSINALTGAVGSAVSVGAMLISHADYESSPASSSLEDFRDNAVSDASKVMDNVGNTATNIIFGKTSMDRTGNSSPAAALSHPLYCYLIVSQPNWERPANYNHTYGKICHYASVLGNVHGFTICRNVDTTGLNCTKLEQKMIKEYLESGVFL